MIIGVDAGTLSVHDERLKVGVYRVVLNLLQVLGHIDKENFYKLYSFAPIEAAVMAQFGQQMKNVVLRPTRGWFSLRLPLELRLHPVDVFLGVAQALPRTGSRKIGFVYDLGFLHAPRAYPKSLARLRQQTQTLVERAYQIVAISHSTKDDLLKYYGLADTNVIVAYPGIDRRFTSRRESFKGKHPYFLFVGALKPGKNIPAAIRAFARFLKQSPRAYDFFLVGGDYWPDPEIARTIEQHHLQGRVKLLGHVPDERLPAYYRGAVALVNPSLWEGFCLPAVEAMACGCPIIASTAGSLPEIVGPAGILIEPEDTKAIAAAMKKMVTDFKARDLYIQEGLKRIVLFSWDNFGKTVLELIRST